jgi:hypothetical protein
MKLFAISALSAVTLGSSFEPANFNVADALLDNGVDIAAIPGLAGLVERSSRSACSIAVSLPRLLSDTTLTLYPVYYSQEHIRKQ